MSTDLTIDLFAKDLFNALWQHHGLNRAEHPELQQHPKSDEFNDDIFRAVQVRQTMFQLPYKALFENTHAEFAGNRSDFFNAIVDFFPHYLSGEDPEEECVMCMFLSSVAFVADMVLWCESEGDDFLDVADKAWAMFADLRLKDAFYMAGGWEELQCFAKTDLVVYDYVRTFSALANCHQGKDVMIHQPHLTCGAVESFEEFEVWEGVDDGAPYALKWVDFCVHAPFVKISSPDYYSQPVPFVFNKLEAALWSLNMICDPVKDDDFSEEEEEDDDDDDDHDSDAAESSTCSSTAKTALKEKVLELCRKFESANCAIRKETLKDDDCSDDDDPNAKESFACSSRVKTALIEKVLELRSALENPNSVTREEKSSGLRSTSSSESFIEMDEEKIRSNIGNYEQVVFVKKLPSCKVQTDSKVIKTENEKSFHYNKMRSPVDNPSLENRVETFRGLEGDLTGLLSQGIVTAPNDPSYFCSANDRDDTQPQVTQFVQTSSRLKITHQNSILTNDDENYHILEKSLTVLEPTGNLSRPPLKKEHEHVSQDSSSTDQITKGDNSSAEPTVENQIKLPPESKSSFKTKHYYDKLLRKTECEMPSVKPTNENPNGFDGKKAKRKKSKKELNLNDSNCEALQTVQNVSTTAEPVLENPIGLSSPPQDAEKKGKKKKPKKRISRLEQRVKEEGDGIYDVTKLIFVMGHEPGMASVASAFHDSEKQISKDDINKE